jgi:hypothetical protein
MPSAAEGPSIASRRTILSPSGHRAVFCAGARRAAVVPATAVALPPPRRGAGPGCRCPAHGTATPRPWDATTRARACAPLPRDPAVPASLLAAPRLAPASPCASTPRRGRDVAFASWPSLWGLSPSTVRAPTPARAPRHPHAHMHAHLPHRIRTPPQRITRRPTCGTALSAKEKTRSRRAARRRRRSDESGPRRKRSRPTKDQSRASLHAQPAHRPGRPAEPQAEPTPEVKPSLVGRSSRPNPF